MRRVVVAAGSCLETATLPYHLMRLRAAWPDLEVEVALSPRSIDFVTPLALAGVVGSMPYVEGEPMDRDGRPRYLRLAEAEVLVLYPATARIIAETALGIISCPVTRTFSFMEKSKVIVTPYLHPAMESRLYVDHLDRLSSIGCRIALPDRDLRWVERSAWVATQDLLVDVMQLPVPVGTPPSWSAARSRAS